MTTGEYGVVTDLYALIPFILLLLTMGMETGYFHFAGKAIILLIPYIAVCAANFFNIPVFYVG